ncbi:ferredoxin [Lentzea flaviverrucosa]|nr:ferredoxin [Lentzea flaviverrucosa]
MKVGVDQKLCLSSGQCVLAAVDVFDQRDYDGVVILRDPAPPESAAEGVRAAAAACPALAIRIEE